MPVLQFKGKTAVENYHHTVPHHRLEFDTKLSLLGKGETSSLDGNLIIEGDNLLALKALLPTHAGKVKCIYIDPPYNTGNEGWVYNDNLTQPQFKEWIGQTVGKEGEDACRHDKWCCMMYPRLVLLRELLRDDGIIFVSIDDSEFGNIRLLLDEIFHVSMPFATFVWKRRSPTGMRPDPVSVDHEYVLAYAKNVDRVQLSGTVMVAGDYPYEDSVGRYASTDLTIGMSSEERPNQFYKLVNPRTKKTYPANPDRVWRFEPGEMKRVIKDDLIIWPEDHPELRMTRPRFKTRFDPDNPKIKPVSSWITGIAREKTESKSDDSDRRVLRTGLNQEGGRVLKRIFGKKVFNYPKPPSLIQSLVTLAAGRGEIVLDSFAGSGTTGESVLAANRNDKLDRRFLMVQQAHDSKSHESDGFNVCQAVTAERIRKLSEGYRVAGKKQKTVPGLGGTFTYARVGEPLLGENRTFTDTLPSFEDLASYIFYTETSREFPGTTKEKNPAWNKKTGRIGEQGGRSYYLLYTPNDREDCGLDRAFLKDVADGDPNRELVVYCERLAVHAEELRLFRREKGKTIRPMIVPFGLK